MTPGANLAQADDGLALADEAILGLLTHLRDCGYRFVTPNRATHTRVQRRRTAGAADLLRDVFGWTRPAAPGLLPHGLERALRDADLLSLTHEGLRARIRVSSMDDLLFVHSAPGAGGDAVFLGPDSYRYARFLRQALGDRPSAERALDIGTGAGVGALTLLARGLATEVTGTDVNPDALRYADLNAFHAGLPLRSRLCSGLPPGPGRYDLIVANPPFVAGDTGATYRDGGDALGSRITLDWSKASLPRLNDGGRFVLYTGAPVIRGVDQVREALSDLARQAGMSLHYEEIDPDIFGSLLGTEAYRDVERIAAVGAVVSC